MGFGKPSKGKRTFSDVLQTYFGGDPTPPQIIAAGGRYVRDLLWIRFTCRGLDYAIERELFGTYTVQVGSAFRKGRPEDISAFKNTVDLKFMQHYNEDLFYWIDIQVALGDPDESRGLEEGDFDSILAALAGLEPRLKALFSDKAASEVRLVQEKRVKETKASYDRELNDTSPAAQAERERKRLVQKRRAFRWGWIRLAITIVLWVGLILLWNRIASYLSALIN